MLDQGAIHRRLRPMNNRMRTSLLVSLLFVFTVSFLGCHRSSGETSVSQITDLRHIGTWDLFQILSMRQLTQNYTEPPESFAIENSALTQIGGIFLNTGNWWHHFYDKEGLFRANTPIGFEDQQGNLVSILFSWAWFSNTLEMIEEHGAMRIDIDRESNVPQIIMIWKIIASRGDIGNRVITEDSATETLFRPR